MALGVGGGIVADADRVWANRLDGAVRACPELPAAALCAASVGAACAGAITHDGPHGPVLCPFRLATGLPCPFCGLTRSLFALGRGDLHASVGFSPIGPLALVLAVVLLPLTVRAIASRRGIRWPRPALLAGAWAVAASWIFQLSKGVFF